MGSDGRLSAEELEEIRAHLDYQRQKLLGHIAALENDSYKAASLFNDMIDRQQAEIARLKAKLNGNTCNKGHTTLPLVLWDCPACTEEKREEIARLRGENDRLDAVVLGNENTIKMYVQKIVRLQETLEWIKDRSYGQADHGTCIVILNAIRTETEHALDPPKATP